MKKSRVEGLTLAWDDLTCTVTPQVDFMDRIRRTKKQKKKTILSGVSGLIEPGTLTALMGPSGAGKTSLMNILTHRNVAGLDVQGNVMLNGIHISKISSYNTIVGFIQQHDVLPGTLTVREHLSFMAALLYSRSMTKDERDRKVQATIHKVSLQKCADTLIGGEMAFERISGGERKRVSIATQLLNDPSVLLLDEPTTGMDAFIAQLLVHILHDLAGQGYTILCTIHQPSSEVFLCFDRLILLADGRNAYVGPRSKTVSHFSELGFMCPDNYLPADYFIELLTRKPGLEVQTTKTIEYLCDHYDKSKGADVLTKLDAEYRRAQSSDQMDILVSKTEAKKECRASVLTQLLLLLMRECKGIVRMPARLVGQTVTAAFSTFMFLGIFWNPDAEVNQRYITNNFGIFAIFILQLGGGLNAMGLLSTWAEMLPLVVKETKDGTYTSIAYYISAAITETLFASQQLFVVFFPLYYGAGLHHSQEDFVVPLKILMILSFTAVICVAFCANIIMISETMEVAMGVVVPIYVVFFMFGGFFVNTRSVDSGPTLVVLWMDWMSWSAAWIHTLQWENVTDIGCEMEDELSCLQTGDEVIYKYGYEQDKTEDACFLAGELVFFHVVAITVMLLKFRYKFTG